MKARECGFLLVGLFLGVIACAAVLISHRGNLISEPVVFQAPAPPPEMTAIQTPDVAAPGGKVYLAGEVHTEGAFEIRPGETVTVSQAIALAGGLAAFGDVHNVKLMRRRPDGTSDMIPVDLGLSKSGYVKDPTVEPGDLVNVPTKIKNS